MAQIILGATSGQNVILTTKMTTEKKLEIFQDKTLMLPDYQGKCIVHIPDHIAYLHGLKEQSNLASSIKRTNVKKTILFTVDGFGYKQWREHQSDLPALAKFAEKGSIQSVTSMFPSSTTPSITGLSTGKTTQQHGLIEWWMYNEAIDKIITTLPFTTLDENVRDSLVGQIEPSVLVSDSTLFQNLSKGGLKSYSLVSKEYSNSTYSSLVYAGSDIVAHEGAEELFSNLSNLLHIEERAHINVYWDKIDATGHNVGPSGPDYTAEVKHFFDLFETFLSDTKPTKDASEIIVQITADHGQIAVDPQKTIWLNEVPGFNDNLGRSEKGNLIMPWGLQRDIYIKVRSGKIDETCILLRDYLKDKAMVMKSRDALDAGLFGFGKQHPDFVDRIGDLLIIPRGDNTVWYNHNGTEVFRYKGIHGGLSPDEVRIAFAEASLANLLEA